VIQEKTIDTYYNLYVEEVDCDCGVKNIMDSDGKKQSNGIRKMKNIYRSLYHPCQQWSNTLGKK